MIKKIKERLSLQLLLFATLSLFTAYLSNTLFLNLSYRLLDSHFYTKEAIAGQERRCMKRLQEYVDDNQITSRELSLVHQWARGEKYVSLTMIRDDEVFFEAGDASNAIPMEISNIYDITFHDGVTLMVSPYCYYETVYYSFAYRLCYAVSFAAFLGLFLLLIQGRLKAVHRLADELKILEGGDLHFAVTEKGQDEIYLLANGINHMRLAILDKQDKELQNREANRKLVTALSHDLRTPLTSLIGFLEILSRRQYQNEEQMAHFIQISREKAFQIKSMSDQLFEYFLVSERTNEAYSKVTVLTRDLVADLKENQLFDLKNQGFLVDTDLNEQMLQGACCMDTDYLKRVLDNIMSNLKKYAAKSQPVTISANEKDGFFGLTFCNTVSKEAACESTGMGVKTCEKIMEAHGGRFESRREGTLFYSGLWLPLCSFSCSHNPPHTA